MVEIERGGGGEREAGLDLSPDLEAERGRDRETWSSCAGLSF